MPLTHFDLRNTKPAAKPFKISDGGVLFILVQPHGAMFRRLKYRYLAKKRVLSFGAYPVVSLADARDKREAAKKLLANGKDPASERRLEGLASETAARNIFGLVAAEYNKKPNALRVPNSERIPDPILRMRRDGTFARSSRFIVLTEKWDLSDDQDDAGFDSPRIWAGVRRAGGMPFRRGGGRSCRSHGGSSRSRRSRRRLRGRSSPRQGKAGQSKQPEQSRPCALTADWEATPSWSADEGNMRLVVALERSSGAKISLCEGLLPHCDVLAWDGNCGAI